MRVFTKVSRNVLQHAVIEVELGETDQLCATLWNLL